MVPTTKSPAAKETVSFNKITERILTLLESEQAEQLKKEIKAYRQSHQKKGHDLLLQGVEQFLRKDFAGVVASMGEANRWLDDSERPELISLYSQMYIKAQVMLPKRRRPAVIRGQEYFERNVAALGEGDPVLAQEVHQAEWPGEYMLLEYWGGHYFFYSGGSMLLLMDEQVKRNINESIRTRTPFAFGGIASGQEIRYCLREQYEGLHGMTRVHYLFEKEPQRIKALLHLDDFSAALRHQELIILGGCGQAERIQEVFGSLRYPGPQFTIEAGEKLAGYVETINEILNPVRLAERMEAYYRSDEFRQRRRQIATGEIMPRILVDTCRWTTFLKYCAKDFEKAFGKLGCETRYLIEENDVQMVTPTLMLHELDQFHPDIVFMVSHARPSLPYVPEALGFVSFIQDKCGPLEAAADLSETIQPHDLLVCATENYRRWLLSKNATTAQTCVLPVPADDNIFFPLEAPTEEKYVADVGFVKHGGPEVEKAFADFIAHLPVSEDAEAGRDGVLHIIRAGFEDLYQQFCLGELDPPRYDDEMTEFLLRRIQPQHEQARHQLERLIWMFYCQVYSNAWRYHFLEKLDSAGIQLALYGNHWEQHARLGHLGRGPVEHGAELNQVYNFNQISLSINHFVTMNQRISECTLAGGFVMAASHQAGKDGIDARDYYREGEEIVFFDSAADLIDKCRYFLAHPEQRRRIAENARRRAQAELTVEAAAKKMLSQWRNLLG